MLTISIWKMKLWNNIDSENKVCCIKYNETWSCVPFVIQNLHFRAKLSPILNGTILSLRKNCGGGLMPAGYVVIKYNWLYFYFCSSSYRYEECLHYSNCNSGCHNIILVIDKEVNSNTYAYLINGYIVIALWKFSFIMVEIVL